MPKSDISAVRSSQPSFQSPTHQTNTKNFESQIKHLARSPFPIGTNHRGQLATRLFNFTQSASNRAMTRFNVMALLITNQDRLKDPNRVREITKIMRKLGLNGRIQGSKANPELDQFVKMLFKSIVSKTRLNAPECLDLLDKYKMRCSKQLGPKGTAQVAKKIAELSAFLLLQGSQKALPEQAKTKLPTDEESQPGIESKEGDQASSQPEQEQPSADLMPKSEQGLNAHAEEGQPHPHATISTVDASEAQPETVTETVVAPPALAPAEVQSVAAPEQPPAFDLVAHLIAHLPTELANSNENNAASIGFKILTSKDYNASKADGLDKWLYEFLHRSQGISSEQLASFRKSTRINSLIRNFGVQNALALLSISYQIAYHLTSVGSAQDRSEAKRSARELKHVLIKLNQLHPEECQKALASPYTFVFSNVRKEFLDKLNKPSEQKKTWSIAAGALLGLAAIGGLVALRQAFITAPKAIDLTEAVNSTVAALPKFEMPAAMSVPPLPDQFLPGSSLQMYPASLPLTELELPLSESEPIIPAIANNHLDATSKALFPMHHYQSDLGIENRTIPTISAPVATLPKESPVDDNASVLVPEGNMWNPEPAAELSDTYVNKSLPFAQADQLLDGQSDPSLDFDHASDDFGGDPAATFDENNAAFGPDSINMDETFAEQNVPTVNKNLFFGKSSTAETMDHFSNRSLPMSKATLNQNNSWSATSVLVYGAAAIASIATAAFCLTRKKNTFTLSDHAIASSLGSVGPVLKPAPLVEASGTLASPLKLAPSQPQKPQSAPPSPSASASPSPAESPSPSRRGSGTGPSVDPAADASAPMPAPRRGSGFSDSSDSDGSSESAGAGAPASQPVTSGDHEADEASSDSSEVDEVRSGPQPMAVTDESEETSASDSDVKPTNKASESEPDSPVEEESSDGENGARIKHAHSESVGKGAGAQTITDDVDSVLATVPSTPDQDAVEQNHDKSGDWKEPGTPWLKPPRKRGGFVPNGGLPAPFMSPGSGPAPTPQGAARAEMTSLVDRPLAPHNLHAMAASSGPTPLEDLPRPSEVAMTDVAGSAGPAVASDTSAVSPQGLVTPQPAPGLFSPAGPLPAVFEPTPARSDGGGAGPGPAEPRTPPRSGGSSDPKSPAAPSTPAAARAGAGATPAVIPQRNDPGSAERLQRSIERDRQAAARHAYLKGNGLGQTDRAAVAMPHAGAGARPPVHPDATPPGSKERMHAYLADRVPGSVVTAIHARRGL